MGNFVDQARFYIRNPLGIIALSFVFTYSVALIILPFSKNLPNFSLICFTIFLIIYPVGVFIIFLYLVTHHHTKLYSPMDFPRIEDFMGCAFGGKSVSYNPEKYNKMESEEPQKKS